MNEFLSSIAKGIQLPLFVLALTGFFFLIKEKKWTIFNSCILVAFFLFEIFAALQVWFFYGELQTSSRYLLIGTIFYLPFTAHGLINIYKYLRKNKYYIIATYLVLFVYFTVNAYNIYSPIIKDYSSKKHQRKRIFTLRAAKIIQNDWKCKNTSPLLLFKCDCYQSGKRPLVESEFGQTGYLAGGQTMSDFLKYKNCEPDYLVTFVKISPYGYYKMDKIAYRNETLYIHRKIRSSFQ